MTVGMIRQLDRQRSLPGMSRIKELEEVLHNEEHGKKNMQPGK